MELTHDHDKQRTLYQYQQPSPTPLERAQTYFQTITQTRPQQITHEIIQVKTRITSCQWLITNEDIPYLKREAAAKVIKAELEFNQVLLGLLTSYQNIQGISRTTKQNQAKQID